MKTMFVFLLAVGFFFISCSGDEIKTDVELFIEQVEQNIYVAEKLPEFSSDAISELLESANNFTVITNFPVNPVVSQGPLRVTVCSVLLWEIEHIRTGFGNYSENLYPSNLPELMKLDKEVRTLDNAQLLEVYNLYYNWWYDNNEKDFETFRNLNPLEEIDYMWK